ncbi:hypothetical protein N7470_001245, partial [Penicillium chermesinum]
WSLLIGLIIVVAACAAGWFFSPKGRIKLKTFLLRSSIRWCKEANLVSLAIVFLAQLHPLIAPKRSDIRPGRVPN